MFVTVMRMNVHVSNNPSVFLCYSRHVIDDDDDEDGGFDDGVDDDVDSSYTFNTLSSCH